MVCSLDVRAGVASAGAISGGEQRDDSLLVERAGVLAGLALCLLELWLLRNAHASLVLWLVSAAVILFTTGLLVLGLRLGLLLSRLPGERHPWRRAGVGALLCLPLAIWIAILLFSGTWIAGTAAGRIGPWVAAPALFAAVLAGLRLTGAVGRWLRQQPRALRRGLVLPVIGFCGLLLWIDRTVYPNQYGYLHWLLLAGTALGLMAVGWLLWIDGKPRRWHWLAPALLAAAIPAFVTSAMVGLSSERRKQALMEHSHSAGRLVDFYRLLLDRDRDGHSVIFGDRDCDDSDPSIHPLAREVPGDGIDQNCDGQDGVADDGGGRSPDPGARPAGGGPIGRETYRQLVAGWREVPEVAARLRDMAQYNLLLVVVDAMRGELLAPTADNRANHPNLIRLGEQGRTFSRAFSPGAGTDIGMSSLLTGQLLPLAREQVTLMRACADAGMTTHGVFQREVARWLGRQLRLDGLAGQQIVINDPRRRDVGERATARQVTEHSIRFLRQRGVERRFMLWAHYFDLHEHHQIDPASLEEPERYRAPRGMPFYRRLLAYTDLHLGRLLAALSDLGLAQRTIVVLVSDHGEGLAETSRLPQTHGDLLFNQLIHVVLTIRVPGVEGRRIETAVSLTDVHPTLHDLLGLPRRSDTHGLSLAPLLIDGPAGAFAARLQRPILLYEAQQRGVIVWPYKLLVWWDRGLKELYDLERDFGESFNLADDLPGRVRELAQVIGRYDLPRVDRLAEIRRQRRR